MGPSSLPIFFIPVASSTILLQNRHQTQGDICADRLNWEFVAFTTNIVASTTSLYYCYSARPPGASGRRQGPEGLALQRINGGLNCLPIRRDVGRVVLLR